MSVKWSAFPSGTTIGGTDVTVGLQGGANVQWTWSQALTYVLGGSGTLTNKTFDTAGTGNTFKINGTTVNALTGTGSTVVASSGPTLTGTLTLTGGTVTASTPLLDASQTWNGVGIAFTALKLNVTNTNSATSSMLLDLQYNNVSYYQFTRPGGSGLVVGNNSAAGAVSVTNSTGAGVTQINGTNFLMSSGGQISWDQNATLSGNGDTFLRRSAAATLQLGAADTTAAVAQTLKVQGVTGVADTAGAAFTIKGSAGTGTGAGGSLIFQVAPAGSTGSSQNAFATALTINSSKQVQYALGTAALPAITSSTGNSGIFFSNGGDDACLSYAGSQFATFTSSSFRVGSTSTICWSSAASSISAADTIIARDAANTLALRNSTNAQTFRVYKEADAGLTNTSFGYMEAGVTANTLIMGSNKVGSPSVALTKLQINVDGTNRADYGVTTASTWTLPVNVQLGSSSNLTHIVFTAGSASTALYSAGDGQLRLSNYAGTDFARLQFGGTTSSFPALKRVSANLQVLAADGTSSAGFIVGNQALSTSATDGFLYIPTCAGTPTGVPTTQTGTVAMVYDTTNNKFYIYNGGWKGGTNPGVFS